MNAYVIQGGSGTWNLICNGKTLAYGHIPDNAPPSVIGRQISRLPRAERPGGRNKLGGGTMLSLEKCEVALSDVERLLATYTPPSSPMDAFKKYHQ